jgi:predicted helicase
MNEKAEIFYKDIGDYLSRKEGGKIFGSGNRTPAAVTILVKRGIDKPLNPAKLK